MRALFYGLGSDGTVGANKNSIKIIGSETPNYAQGYFVYDSKKSGSVTTVASALRAGPDPVDVPDQQGKFCRLPPVPVSGAHGHSGGGGAGRGVPAEFALWAGVRFGATCRRPRRRQFSRRSIKFYVIDGYTVARETGMGNRINTIMQTCFFAISGVLPARRSDCSRSRRRSRRPMASAAMRWCRRTMPRWMRRWHICTQVEGAGRSCGDVRHPAHDARSRRRRLCTTCWARWPPDTAISCR